MLCYVQLQESYLTDDWDRSMYVTKHGIDFFFLYFYKLGKNQPNKKNKTKN